MVKKMDYTLGPEGYEYVGVNLVEKLKRIL